MRNALEYMVLVLRLILSHRWLFTKANKYMHSQDPATPMLRNLPGVLVLHGQGIRRICHLRNWMLRLSLLLLVHCYRLPCEQQQREALSCAVAFTLAIYHHFHIAFFGKNALSA